MIVHWPDSKKNARSGGGELIEVFRDERKAARTENEFFFTVCLGSAGALRMISSAF